MQAAQLGLISLAVYQPLYRRWSSIQVVSEETQGPESIAGADETSSFRQRGSWGGAGGDPGHCEREREGKLLADVASIFQLENLAKVGKICSSMHTIQLGTSWILKHLVYFACIYSIETRNFDVTELYRLMHTMPLLEHEFWTGSNFQNVTKLEMNFDLSSGWPLEWFCSCSSSLREWMLSCEYRNMLTCVASTVMVLPIYQERIRTGD